MTKHTSPVNIIQECAGLSMFRQRETGQKHLHCGIVELHGNGTGTGTGNGVHFTHPSPTPTRVKRTPGRAANFEQNFEHRVLGLVSQRSFLRKTNNRSWSLFLS